MPFSRKERKFLEELLKLNKPSADDVARAFYKVYGENNHFNYPYVVKHRIRKKVEQMEEDLELYYKVQHILQLLGY